jgi:hypothetical protein
VPRGCRPGANTATLEFTTATPALLYVGRIERFFETEENILFFKTEENSLVFKTEENSLVFKTEENGLGFKTH